MPNKFAPSFYEPDKDGNYVFGNKCHMQQQAAFPVWAVTDLEDNILISNAPDLDRGRAWLLLKGRTNINRYWQASTAYFQCTLASLDVTEDIPLAPNGLYRHPVTEDSLIAKTALGSATPEELNAKFGKIALPTSEGEKKALANKITELIAWVKKGDPTLTKKYETYYTQLTEFGLDLSLIKATEAGDPYTATQEDGSTVTTYAVNEDYIKRLNEFITYLNAGEVKGARSAAQIDADLRAQPLYILDEICIYAGYIDSLRPVTKADIEENRLLRKGVWSVDTVTYSGSASTGVIWTVQCRDRLKYLMDTFGSYNTAENDEFFLKSASDALGQSQQQQPRSQVILALCRRAIGDLGPLGVSLGGRRIKQGFIYDIDVFSSGQESNGQTNNAAAGFNPYLPYIGEVYVKADGVTAAKLSADSKEAQLIPGSDTKVSVVLSMSDDDIKELFPNKEPDEVRRMSVEQGSVTYGDGAIPPGTDDTPPTTEAPRTVNSLQYVGTLQGRTTNVPLSKEMKFNIMTGRVSYGTNASAYFGQNFIVADRVPLDYVRFLSQQEPWPTEVFQDHRTGEFWYTVRGLDITGLYDPKRFNRTYFFRQYPEDLRSLNGAKQYTPEEGSEGLDLNLSFPHAYPHNATMLTSFREEASAVSMRTNIIVQTHAPGGTQPTKILHLAVEPPFLENRSYPCSFFTITDDTADAVPGTMVAVALAYARVIGKEVRAAAATLLGDPSLTPGEVIQVLGSPMHQGTTDTTAVFAERQKLLDMSLDYIQFYRDMPKVAQLNPDGGLVPIKADGKSAIKTADGKSAIQVDQFNVGMDGVQKDSMARAGDSRPNTITFSPEPVTMWRVDGVVDKFNDGVQGYYTEVSLLSCF